MQQFLCVKIEFLTLGQEHTHSVRPTAISYEYEWFPRKRCIV